SIAASTRGHQPWQLHERHAGRDLLESGRRHLRFRDSPTDRASGEAIPPMRILRVRRGFQADHSSSSYLFYAVDHEVSKAGQAIANRFSSRAEVDEQYARYVKWGESELSSGAFEALLDEHYDVMVEESYSWW